MKIKLCKYIYFQEKRCNSRPDCFDKSDELNCKRIEIDEYYQQYIVPPPHHQESD